MSDLFNNTQNDYINPDLAACPGNADTNTFEFLAGREVGIISGNDIVMSMNLGDISQEVTAWLKQKQLLQPGEVIFIPGLTKGVSHKAQVFPIDGFVAENYSYLDSMYMSVDLSISYYQNFRYYEAAIYATADEAQGIDIAAAINIELGTKGINTTVAYDPSNFTFTGSTAGYNYNVFALDVSRWTPDTSTVGNSLTEDASSQIPAFKYPNGAMLGYVLKVTYPTTASDDSLKYININHVPDYLTYFELNLDSSCNDCYSRYYKAVDAGMNGYSTDIIMSAGDYLNHVDINDKWEKVGVLRMWITAEDPTISNIENLITGLYLYNPQTFAVQVEYITML